MVLAHTEINSKKKKKNKKCQKMFCSAAKMFERQIVASSTESSPELSENTSNFFCLELEMSCCDS